MQSGTEQTIVVVNCGSGDMETRESIAVVDVKHLSLYTLIPRTALNPLSSPLNKGVILLGQETLERQARGCGALSKLHFWPLSARRIQIPCQIDERCVKAAQQRRRNPELSRIFERGYRGLFIVSENDVLDPSMLRSNVVHK